MRANQAMKTEPLSVPQIQQLKVNTAVVPSEPYRGAETTTRIPPLVTVVRPKTGDEIEGVIKWARKAAVPMSVVSSGSGPRRRGLTSDQAGVVVDLSGMKQVFQVDPDEAVAIIQPGLSFAELDRALAPHGLRSFKPLLPRAGKSALASYIEREPLTNVREHWDVLDPLGAAELIFGTGERFYTGAAGNPGSMAEHWKAGMRYMTATGPVGTDFMRVMQGSQGTLGVVSWAAIFCDRLPSAEHSLLIGSDTLEPVLRLASEMHYRRLGHSSFISSRQHLAMVAAASGAARKTADLPGWSLFVNVAASADLPQERVEYEVSDIEALAAAEGLRAVTEIAGWKAQSIVDRHTSLHNEDYKNHASGAHRQVFFLTQTDKVVNFIGLATELAARQSFSMDDVGIYLQHRLHGRNCHLEFVIPHGPSSASVGGFADALALACCEAGGHFSRPYGNWTSMALARNASLLPFLHHTKSMFDPDRILHPERLGL